MRRFLSLLALVCVGLACAGVAQAAPTCLLTELKLLTNSNQPLQIRDSDGLGYNHNSNVYFCNCDNTVDTVRVSLKSDQATEKKTGYWLEFKNGEGQEFEQDLFNGVLSTPLHFRPDLNRIIIHAYSPTCTKKVTVHCTQTPGDGEAVGDPQFAGLRGQDYQVHGVSGEVYNIITDEHMQMNSKFVFLDQGECPTFNGERALGCFSHPGSYLGEIGIKTANGDRVKIVAGDYKNGFASIELNGQKMEPGQTATLPADNGMMSGFVTFNHSFVVTVQAGNFLLQFENSDMFINQRVRVLDWSKLSSHGLLGQTWRNVEYKNAIKYVEGQVDDYVVEGKDLFGDKFVFNRFEQRGEGHATPRGIEQAEQEAQNELVSTLPQQAMERMPEIIADIVNESSSFVADLVSSAQALLGRHEEGGPSALELAIPPSDDPDVLVAEIKEGAYEQDPLDATAAGQIMGGAPVHRRPETRPAPKPVQYGEDEAYVLTAEIKEGAYYPDPLDATAAGRRLGITTPQQAQESVIVEVKTTGEEPTFAVAQEPAQAQEAVPPHSHHGRRRRRSVQLVEN